MNLWLLNEPSVKPGRTFGKAFKKLNPLTQFFKSYLKDEAPQLDKRKCPSTLPFFQSKCDAVSGAESREDSLVLFIGKPVSHSHVGSEYGQSNLAASDEKSKGRSPDSKRPEIA